uniref:Uncharacterized protein n=1 Tax=Chlamydomonas euryale TaxID=1486919 RepID=A0A7R9Z5E7_9CHLO|mmetsp:Transcript_45172/g.134859  ORF Transcript_45172/g.134859 Transcript_45172/m.134859 type:complete len:312 (+) Transcript_45172:434-1369(+)
MAKMKARMAKGQKYMKADPHEEFASDLEDGEDEEGATSEEEAGPQPGALREPIYDVDGMHEKLEDISWVEDASWEDAQVITAADEIHIENIDDDLERELAFYNQALVASHAAIAKFETAGIPWRRPTDYYAEMVKTDTHMARVKQQLMHEQKQIELAEERRKQREQKQFSKQVQAEKLKQKQQDKKKQISDISKMRKQRDKSGYEGEADFDAVINQGAAASRGKGKMQDRNRPGASGPGKLLPAYVVRTACLVPSFSLCMCVRTFCLAPSVCCTERRTLVLIAPRLSCMRSQQETPGEGRKVWVWWQEAHR